MECDVLIVGGGMGGCAAALTAASREKRVILLEETKWIGGQMTSQGVSALDEHEYIESFGGTKTYYLLREGIRNYYRHHYEMSPAALAKKELNPGNGWVSRLCFEPRVALHVLNEMLLPYVQDGFLQIWLETHVTSVITDGYDVESVTVEKSDGTEAEIQCCIVIDATELGDLLPLANIPYVIGAESREDTGEPHAQAEADTERVQSFTYPFAVEWRPGENHRIEKPVEYEHFRDEQPYTFDVWYGEEHGYQTYRMFETSPRGPLSFWTYRRLIDSKQFADASFPQDIAMINWPGNDYRGGNVIDVSDSRKKKLLDEAKRLSLGFLYWLQTEAPRDDGGFGYPELKLRKDVMGTADGLSMFPYIRESRRIKALKRIVEQDICAYDQPHARAKHFEDAVGIGFYPIDIHACCGEDQFDSGGLPSKPYQIPLGALIPKVKTNLIVGNKNIGTTHITNGAYRLHPVEWNIGESAGLLAVFMLDKGKHPHEIATNRELLREFQRRVVTAGVPIYWFIDVPIDDTCFTALQLLAGAGMISGECDSLMFHPDDPLTKEVADEWIQAVTDDLNLSPAKKDALQENVRQAATRRDGVCLLFDALYDSSGITN